ncbi:MAG: hypothetical protein AAF662_05535 [Pseudomonadota bacterium]
MKVGSWCEEDKRTHDYQVFTESATTTYRVANDQFLTSDIEESVLMFPGDRALSFLLAETANSQHSVDYLFEAHPDRYSPARADSIAGAILRNLAYSKRANRLDHCLLESAEELFAKIRALESKSEAEYLNALDRNQR